MTVNGKENYPGIVAPPQAGDTIGIDLDLSYSVAAAVEVGTMKRRGQKTFEACSMLGAAALASAIAGPALADSFSFGDFFFPGDTAVGGFSSVTDQGTPYSVSGPGTGFEFLTQSASGPFGWSGQFKDQVLVAYDGDAAGAVTITFTSPVDSITGLAAQPFATGAYTATLTAFSGADIVGTSTYSSINQPGPAGSVPYFSVFAPGISSIQISTTNDAEGIGLGSNNPGIPEPASWALTLMGFGGLGGALRARRSMRAAA
jgi:hypothetical protein